MAFLYLFYFSYILHALFCVLLFILFKDFHQILFNTLGHSFMYFIVLRRDCLQMPVIAFLYRFDQHRDLIFINSLRNRVKRIRLIDVYNPSFYNRSRVNYPQMCVVTPTGCCSAIAHLKASSPLQ